MEMNEIFNEGLKRKYKITVNAAVIQDAITKMANEMAKLPKYNLPGFRVGKTPPEKIISKYHESILGQVLDDKINEANTKLFNEKSIKIATPPKVDIESDPKEGDLVYSLEFEIMPDIHFPDFTKIILDKYVAVPSDAEVDKFIETIKMRSTKAVPISENRPTQLGDIVVMDYEGKVDDVAFEGGTAENAELELGSNRFIAGFEEQLVGKNIGDEIVVSVTFPEVYHAKNLAGKAALFYVKLHNIMAKEDRELTDEIVKAEIGLESVASLRARLTENIINESAQKSAQKLRKELFDAIDKECDFPVPESMVENEYHSLWQQVEESQKKEQSPNFDEVKFQTIYQKMALRRVRLGLLFAEIAKIRNVEISPTEMREAIYKEAEKFGNRAPQIVEFYRSNQSAYAAIRNMLIEDKIVEFILTQISTKEINVSTEELAKLAEISDEDLEA